LGVHLNYIFLLTDVQASKMITMEYVEKNLDQLLKASILVIEGYFVINKFEMLLFLIEHLNKNNKMICLTLSAVFLFKHFYERIIQISNHSHIIFSNKDEARAFVNLENPDTSIEDVSIAIHKLLKPKDRLVIITHSGLPVCISKFNYEENQLDFNLLSYPTKVNKEEIKDTNGCGDAYLGGFLSQFIQGKSLDYCSKIVNIKFL
jgi:adenosine kinase